jgi:aryl-alcohol dehydrogenase-like predicted oxidoreductase
VERYEACAASLGISPATLGIAWLLHQPAVTAPVVGPRKLEHLTSALDALEVELSQETLDELDAIWPGPGGAAPEAYAW